MTLFYLFLAILAIFTLIKILLLVFYMKSIKPKTDEHGNLVTPRPKKDLSDEDKRDQEEDYDSDW
ncbi:hypothetical protein [Streptococcus sp. zg-JUN1979]|uniref:hypothetical protein n=1 Tax=Streptococcus sp. zg-JUN1979 TaxID=3391450 RepID=UPI0039A500E9